MKILMINNMGSVHGGAEMMIAQLRSGLMERGHEVMILSGDDIGNGEWIADKSFKTFHDRAPLKFFYVFNPSAVLALWKSLKRFRPDIVHVHAASKASPFILALLRNYPTVLTIHDHEYFDPTRPDRVPALAQHRNVMAGYFTYKPSLRYAFEKVRFAALRGFAKNADTVLACSEFYCKCAQDSGIFPQARTLYNGIKLLEYSPIENFNNILFVGRLSKEKGAHTAIEAMNMIKDRHPEAQLTIAGDGEELQTLKEKVKKYGLENKVHFAGHLLPQEITELYKESTMLVVPSIYPDNLPTVCIEAMSAGRPVIGSRIGGIPELVTDEKTGMLFTPGNVRELAEKLDALLQNNDLAQKMGRNGRKIAEEKFEAGKFIDNIIKEYKKLLKETA